MDGTSDLTTGWANVMKGIVIVGLMLATSIAGAIWTRQPAMATPVTQHWNCLDAQSVAAASAVRIEQPNATRLPRRLLGVWLLATAGTAVVLSARGQRHLIMTFGRHTFHTGD